MVRRTSAIVPQPKQIKSRKHARKLTTEYHRITEMLHQAESCEEQAKFAAELNALGGVDAYQKASVFNTSLHSTSRWVVKRLRMRDLLSHGRDRPRVLEIGAINTELLTTPGLSVRAIDLNSQDPRIEQQDFMQLPHGGEFDASTALSRTYDALVCSMVLNCVPDARMRFDFLISMRSQLRKGGLAFIVLPRSCLAHSRTLTHDSFVDCLRAVGLPPDLTIASPESAKLVYFECVASLPDEDAAIRYQRMRHEMRKRPGQRRKSRGAGFDVDLGGHLGFGARVARSFEPAVLSRAKREQRLACEEFLRQQGAMDAEALAAVPALDSDRSNSAHDEQDAKEAAELSRGSRRTAEDIMIDEVAQEHVGRLDFADWRWQATPPLRQGGLSSSEAGEWAFAPELSAATRMVSLQKVTGWQWTRGGWTHAAPTLKVMRSAGSTATTHSARLANHEAAEVAGPVVAKKMGHRLAGIQRRTIRRRWVREQRVMTCSSWRYTNLPIGVRLACWWLWV
jgi:25S rRNA (adenine2142-N1)-methyltransferase